MSSSNVLHAPPHITSLLTRLHKDSSEQEAAIDPTEHNAIKSLHTTDPHAASEALDNLMRDKFIALDQDKAEFVFQSIISMRALNIIEIGTSFGLSTIYLAHALRTVESLTSTRGTLIATEKEATKAARAREYWSTCGPEIASRIQLREGDLQTTLSTDLPEYIDFVLLDIWPPVALPALRMLMPFLRRGAVVVTDNTVASAERYEELLGVLRGKDFRSICLPFKGGLEVSVYLPEETSD